MRRAAPRSDRRGPWGITFFIKLRPTRSYGVFILHIKQPNRGFFLRKQHAPETAPRVLVAAIQPLWLDEAERLHSEMYVSSCASQREINPKLGLIMNEKCTSWLELGSGYR